MQALLVYQAATLLICVSRYQCETRLQALETWLVDCLTGLVSTCWSQE